MSNQYSNQATKQFGMGSIVERIEAIQLRCTPELKRKLELELEREVDVLLAEWEQALDQEAPG